MELLPSEQLEDLQCDGLQLIQNKNEYRFTTDAVILANFLHDMTNKTMVEFCAGSGVISLLACHKKHPRKVYAIELQSQLADMAERSVALNNLQDKIEVVCDDLKNAKEVVPCLADVVVCNPPYRKIGSGEKQEALNLALCRHEIATDMNQIAKSASEVLNIRGSFYVIYQASRLAELITTLAKYHLTTKEILPIAPRPNAEPILVVVRSTKCGKDDCILHKPMSVLDDNGEYSPEAKAYYGIDK